MSFVRLVTCGSVDDGKSTLIGRLLFETGSVPLDTLEAARNIRRPGSLIPPGDIDFSLLTDGLEAEREQGITIDVAYRSLELDNKHRILLADSPGHEQYTRNMAVATSNADIAIVLADASRGLTIQTKKHLAICSLMKVRRIIVAINKMDLVNYSHLTFQKLQSEVEEIAIRYSLDRISFLPISALHGENVVEQSKEMTWFAGPTLIESIREAVTVERPNNDFRISVQSVVRDTDYRAVVGRLKEGTLSVGEEVLVLPGERRARIASITRGFEKVETATGDCAIAIELEPDIDASRGDVLIPSNSVSNSVSSRFKAQLVWMHDQPLVPHRSYILMSGSFQVPAMITNIVKKEDFEKSSRSSETIISMNDIGTVDIVIDRPTPLLKFAESKDFGSFILVDRTSADTVAAGMIIELTHSSGRSLTFDYEVTKTERSLQKQQRSRVLWLTGLSGSGKSTIANAVEKSLFASGRHVYVLDGDNLRTGLSKDLGFSPGDRAENVRRVSEVARLMVDAGLIVVVALVSPFESDRVIAKSLFNQDEFSLIWVNTPEETCRVRDTKGLYKKSSEGKLSDLSGVGQKYETPTNFDLMIDGSDSIEENVEKILRLMK